MSVDPSPVVALTTHVDLEPNDMRRLAALCGPFDQNLKQLERRLGIRIKNRGNQFQISGPRMRVRAARALLSELYIETQSADVIAPDTVHLYLQESGVEELLEDGDTIAARQLIRTRRITIKPSEAPPQTDKSCDPTSMPLIVLNIY